MNLGMIYRQTLPLWMLIGCLLCGGCLPPKTIIALPETRQPHRPPETTPVGKSSSEEQRKIEQLIQQLEETEQKLRETQHKTEEVLKKIEKASRTTEESVERIEKAQEKIENIGQKDLP